MVVILLLILHMHLYLSGVRVSCESTLEFVNLYGFHNQNYWEARKGGRDVVYMIMVLCHPQDHNTFHCRCRTLHPSPIMCYYSPLRRVQKDEVENFHIEIE